MRNEVIPAGTTQQYIVRQAGVFHQEEAGKYEGVILLDKSSRAGIEQFRSEIRIWSENKDVVFDQVKKIGEMWPPKTDLYILDLD